MSATPQELIEAAIGSAKCDGAIAFAHSSTASNVRFASNRLTTNGETARTSLTAIAVDGGAVGSLRSDVADVQGAVQIMEKASDLARLSKQAPDAFDLFDGESFGDFGNEKTAPRIADFFDFAASSLDDVFAGARNSGVDAFGYVEASNESIYLGTSTGIRSTWSERHSHFGITAKSEDWSESTWTGQTGRTITDLNPGAALERCERLLKWAGHRRDAPAGRQTVVLSRSCVADMLIWMYWLMAMRDADEGKSAFSNRLEKRTRIGESIAARGVDLYSDPMETGIECLPFVLTSASHSLESVFDNGMPTGRTNWLRDGVLENLVTTRPYAEKQHAPLAPYVANLILDADNAATSSRELISQVDSGLYVNCLWYIRMVDPETALLTGLTRDGVYAIEDGEIVAQVNNFRFNVSPLEMLAGVRAAGTPALATPREFDDVGLLVKAPPLIVDGWNMSTVSEAL